MQDSKSSFHQNPEADLDHDDDSTRFNKPLQELKDSCSQLHYSADYCETSFLNAEHLRKKIMKENTKKYLCRAVVTVVDHLGSVLANLDYRLSKNNAVSETEFRINGLKQRCQIRSQKKFRGNVFWPISGNVGLLLLLKLIGSETEEEVPLFLYTCNQKPSLTKDSSTKTYDANSNSVLPVRDTN